MSQLSSLIKLTSQSQAKAFDSEILNEPSRLGLLS
jgi:hypothetical protein